MRTKEKYSAGFPTVSCSEMKSISDTPTTCQVKSFTEPLLELPEHYEEINDPVDEEAILIDEDTPLEEEPEYTLFSDNEGPEVIEITEREKVTVADFRRLEKQVELLMQMIRGAE
ncbi:hypothetical protein NXX60_26325 [Bacteroides thetaiotaomicron]|nr:hypothetical protein NXX60_26325 [Bacteroides thetaiotaomicron]